MKILIVDDEPIIRNSLRKTIRTSAYADAEILTADNAEDALVALRRSQPEIVLTDIQMPCKNGLTLLKAVTEEKLQTVVICITGYSDFDYVRTALRYQAFDYLLKPVQADLLISCIGRAEQHYRQLENSKKLSDALETFYKNNSEGLRKQFFENLLLDPLHVSTPEEEKQALALGMSFCDYRLLAIRCCPNEEEPLPNQSFFAAYTLSKRLRQNFLQFHSCYIGDIVYLLWKVESPELTEGNMNTLQQLENWASEFAKTELFSSVVLAVSNPGHGIGMLPLLSRQVAACLASAHAAHGAGSDGPVVCFYEDIADFSGRVIDTNDRIAQFVHAIYAGDETACFEKAEHLLQHLRQESEETRAAALKITELNIGLLLRNLGVPNEEDDLLAKFLPRNLDMTNGDAERLRAGLGSLLSAIASARKSHTSQLVDRMLEFINQNFMRPVGLADAAESIGRNASYVSRLLNKELGKGFASLLTEKRIAEAKILLETTMLKTSEIAEKVGYPNPRYFQQVFCSKMEMTPSEYRQIAAAFHES
ncbi:MAG: response regulator [Eubacteriales bacterium]|nr:response regulator [Eubacteriales bacterium]